LSASFLKVWRVSAAFKIEKTYNLSWRVVANQGAGPASGVYVRKIKECAKLEEIE
jgi:hypothetical protein